MFFFFLVGYLFVIVKYDRRWLDLFDVWDDGQRTREDAVGNVTIDGDMRSQVPVLGLESVQLQVDVFLCLLGQQRVQLLPRTRPHVSSHADKV